MTDETNVVPAELDTFAAGMHQRADRVAELSGRLKDIDLGPGSLGLFAQLPAGDAISSILETAEGIRLLGLHLDADATYTSDAATSFRDNEATQAGRFRGPDVH